MKPRRKRKKNVGRFLCFLRQPAKITWQKNMATRNDNGSIDRLTGLGGMGPIPTALATASQHTFGINNQQPLHQPQQPQQRIIGINGHPPIPFVLPPTTAISGLSPPTLATFLPGSSMTPTSTQSILVPSVIGNPQTIQLALQPQQQRALTGLAEPSINATGDATTDDSSNLLANATAQNQPPSPEVRLKISTVFDSFTYLLSADFHSSLFAIFMQWYLTQTFAAT